MENQPRYKPLAETTLFADGRAARPLCEGTVPHGRQHEGEQPHSGELDEALPIPATPDLLRRGQDRFTIFCMPCHGELGDGNGRMIEHGVQRPPSYHINRLRDAPPDHFFDVMTRGLGAMSAHASGLSPADRWAIIAHIRAIQRSQHASRNNPPSPANKRLEAGSP